MDQQTVIDLANVQTFGVWFLIGAALVFFMQCGFAMVEAGFTRAKNAGNIIMKNLCDFCLGTVVFILIGFGILCGEDLVGFIGKPGFDIFSDYANFDWSGFVFNLVFCATTATIVSGAMAERTKFSSYCIYSVLLSAIIYPVEAHWVWGDGWLANLATPFHDFAGSGVIHMVGGLSALIGAAFLGPRIGKFTKTKAGKVKANAIPGHSIVIGALGVFILWFGWYGFNGAAAESTEQLGSIFLTTTIAPAIATVTCLIFTWIKYKKPDVSMCLNASLAGLVAITAGCDVLSGLGAVIVGIVSGFLVCFGVWFLDNVLHIDDPVGAVAVHFLNGMWGVIAVGLFATTSAPLSETKGLFYGGGWSQLGSQLLGMVAILGWTAVTITIVFFVIKKTHGLRVSAEEEVLGLDTTEHNLASAYADFMPSTDTMASDAAAAAATGVTIPESDMILKPTTGKAKLTKIVIMCNPDRLEALQETFNAMHIGGVTVTKVMGYGSQKGSSTYYRGIKTESPTLLEKLKVEAVVAKIPVKTVVDAVEKVLYTGHVGDGKIFIYDVEDVVKIRTGETGYDALQDSENDSES